MKVLIDDSPEKCSKNPAYSCIHPLLFGIKNPPQPSDNHYDGSIDTLPQMLPPPPPPPPPPPRTATTSGFAIPTPSQFHDGQVSDHELEIDGSLFRYLDKLSQFEKSVEEFFIEFGPYIPSDT